MLGVTYSVTAILINVEISHFCLGARLEDFLRASPKFYFTLDFTLPSFALLCSIRLCTGILVVSVLTLIQANVDHTQPILYLAKGIREHCIFWTTAGVHDQGLEPCRLPNSS